MILIEFCEHDNLSNTCSLCCPNPEKKVRKLIKQLKVIQEDYKYIDEGFRCKYCDLEVLTKPSRRTYECAICLNTSHKDKAPNYEFVRWYERNETFFDMDSLKEMESWGEFNQHQQQYLLHKANLSAWYLENYEKKNWNNGD